MCCSIEVAVAALNIEAVPDFGAGGLGGEGGEGGEGSDPEEDLEIERERNASTETAETGQLSREQLELDQPPNRHQHVLGRPVLIHLM